MAKAAAVQEAARIKKEQEDKEEEERQEQERMYRKTVVSTCIWLNGERGGGVGLSLQPINAGFGH